MDMVESLKNRAEQPTPEADEIARKLARLLTHAEDWARKGNGYQWESIVNLTGAIKLLSARITELENSE